MQRLSFFSNETIVADPPVTFPIYSLHCGMTFLELIRFYREHWGCEGTDGAK